MIRSFVELIASLQGRAPRRIAVAGAAAPSIFEALGAAAAHGWVEPVLVGPEDTVRAAAEAAGHPGRLRVVPVDGGDAAVAARAVQEVVAGRADLLMKGTVGSATLLSAVLRSELRTGARLSHVAAVEAGDYGRLQLHTDGGINLVQDLETRREILRHAVGLARRLGNRAPTVAGLALVEKVDPKLPETGEMRALAQWASEGGLGPDVRMEGPVGLDIALSRSAALDKGYASEVAGAVDVFLGPNISAVNFTVKGLVALGGARVAGLVLGARVPIVLLSRSDSADTRLLSVALAVASETGAPQNP